MDAQEMEMSERKRQAMERFVAACEADERIVAAFLSGSYAKGTADAYSDLDFGLIVADESYSDFMAARADFIELLGEPLFLENYEGGGADVIFFILSDGTEGELALGRQSDFTHIHLGAYKVLLDKTGCLSGAVFTGYQPTQDAQIETLRAMIEWFWHDLLHHFITPIARGQLWSAYGGLEDLRRLCVNLARLREDFQVEADGYEKVEQALTGDQLAPLQATFCPMERASMLRAAHLIVQFYQQVAPALAQEHAIRYPVELARLLCERLDQLG